MRSRRAGADGDGRMNACPRGGVVRRLAAGRKVNAPLTMTVAPLPPMSRIAPFVTRAPATHPWPRRRLSRPVAMMAAAVLLSVSGVGVLAPRPAAAASETERGAREKELERLRAEQQKAAENEARLKGEIAALGEDRRALSQSLIDTAARLREVEGRIADSEARLGILDSSESNVRQALEARRAVIAELLAALQRMGRRPPPALIARPEDALAAVRSAIMLGAVLPEMRVEVEALLGDLSELVRVRRDIDTERTALEADLATFSRERQRMTLLVDERQKRQAEAETALGAERKRALTLARQAQSLQELIGRLEREAETSRAAAEREAAARRLKPRDVPRMAPAMAFADARGKLPLPVNGARVRAFGAADDFGAALRGDTVATRAGAQVTAPADGWVVYAGPFRSYGQLLILNAGGGYHVLLAGMERISVDLGQFVLRGEPIATMGGGPRSASAVAMGSSQPTLYIEFRKDGAPVDPGPWWAVNDSEKVRG